MITSIKMIIFTAASITGRYSRSEFVPENNIKKNNNDASVKNPMRHPFEPRTDCIKETDNADDTNPTKTKADPKITILSCQQTETTLVLSRTAAMIIMSNTRKTQIPKASAFALITLKYLSSRNIGINTDERKEYRMKAFDMSGCFLTVFK